MEAVEAANCPLFESDPALGIAELKAGFAAWLVGISIIEPEIGRRRITIRDADLIAAAELVLAWNTHVRRFKSSGKGQYLHCWEVAKELKSLWIADEGTMTAGDIATADELLGKFLKQLQKGFALRNL